MAHQQIPLPIDDVLGAIAAALSQSSALVLRAPPGAGKTTRVPPVLLDAGHADHGMILVLQPRRVAARSAAARIASERHWKLGEEVGYQVRFESRCGPRTKIAVITEGILLRRLLDDPLLTGVAAIVFDEFHERSLASDLALAMARQIQTTVRPELKLIVMSATLETGPLAAFLGGCPVVESRGKVFPVTIEYLPSVSTTPLPDRVSPAVEYVLARTSGDCLVFLPGLGEIKACARQLGGLADERGLSLLQLYGDLPAEQQDRVLEPSGQRKLILATNVAETSLTIPGVTGVVDSGLARVLRFEPRTGLDRLELSPISQASAEQRAGRAGRTQPGLCVRLWPEAAQRSRPAFELPEIRRVDLSSAALQVLCWIEPALDRFPWFEAPGGDALHRAERLLIDLGAMKDGRVTPLGQQMADLPAHPRIARLLIEGQRLGAPQASALAAALLSERDPFWRDDIRGGGSSGAKARSRSDVLDRVQALAQYEKESLRESDLGAINPSAARQIFRARDQLLRMLPRQHERVEHEELLLRALLAAYPDRLAKRRESGSRRGLMVGGRGVRLANSVALADEELYLCVDVDAGDGEALVRQASAVERSWLPQERIATAVVMEFDEQEEKVNARRRTTFAELVLEESPAPLPAPEQVAFALVAAAESRLARALPPNDSPAAEFRRRVQCLAGWLPDADLPSFSDEELRSLLPPLAMGRRSLAELRDGPWLDQMRSLLTWQQLQLVDREAPERIEVPSRNRITLLYEPGRPPILAVRIQEVFGLLQTPRVARGRVPVLMHLLAPNMRVAQVTDDLASFWANTYALVRKDLRARYPKHSWPEDPYTAIAQSRPARKPRN